EFHLAGKSAYFADYCRRYTDLPHLVRLEKQGDRLVAGRFLRASDFEGNLDQPNNPDWKTVVIDEAGDRVAVPTGSIGFRWGQPGRWNLENKDGSSGADLKPRLSLVNGQHEIVSVAFPYFGNRQHAHFTHTDHAEVLASNIPARRLKLKDGEAL